MTTILIAIIALLIIYYAYKYNLDAAENMHVSDDSNGITLRMNNPFGVPCWSCDNSLMYKYKPNAPKDNHNRCCKWP